jgi:predicted Zn-dependent protease
MSWQPLTQRDAIIRSLRTCTPHSTIENTAEAITAWKQALTIQPDSPDSHMNLASAYILSNPPEPGAAIRHLK